MLTGLKSPNGATSERTMILRCAKLVFQHHLGCSVTSRPLSGSLKLHLLFHLEYSAGGPDFRDSGPAGVVLARNLLPAVTPHTLVQVGQIEISTVKKSGREPCETPNILPYFIP